MSPGSHQNNQKLLQEGEEVPAQWKCINYLCEDVAEITQHPSDGQPRAAQRNWKYSHQGSECRWASAKEDSIKYFLPQEGRRPPGHANKLSIMEKRSLPKAMQEICLKQTLAPGSEPRLVTIPLCQETPLLKFKVKQKPAQGSATPQIKGDGRLDFPSG